MISKTPFTNPLGNTVVTFLETDGQVLGMSLLFMALGIIFGNIYIQKISRIVLDEDKKNGFSKPS